MEHLLELVGLKAVGGKSLNEIINHCSQLSK